MPDAYMNITDSGNCQSTPKPVNHLWNWNLTKAVSHSISFLETNMPVWSHRLSYVDWARCIALFLTVFAHLYAVNSDVRLYIYAFHMPLFFLLSGYLHKNTPPGVLIGKSTKRLLIPFTFFLLLGYLYFVISSGSLRWDIIKGSVRGIILGKSILANDVLWFLLALYLVKNIGNLIILYPRTTCMPMVLLFILLYISKRNWLYLGSSFMALPFYLIGYYGKNHIQSLFKSRFRGLFAALFFVASALLTSINGKVSMMATIYGNTGHGILNIALFYLNAIIGSLSILCITSCIPSSSRGVSFIARSSISIVGLQFIPIMIWIKYVGLNQPFLLSLAFTILIIAVCVLFDKIVRIKAEWLLGG